MRMLPVALATVTVVPLFGAEPASVGGKPWCAQIYDRGGLAGTGRPLSAARQRYSAFARRG